MNKFFQSKYIYHTAFRVAAIYALFSLLWIFFSDNLLHFFVKDVDKLNTLQHYKGYFFIIITSGIIYYLLCKEIFKVAKSGQELIESEERYRIMSELTMLLVYDYNLTTKKIKWSGAISQTTLYAPEEFNNFDINSWANAIHDEDREKTIKTLDESILTGKMFKTEYRFKRKDGNYVYIEDSGSFIKDKNGAICRMVGSMKDISERKYLEDQLHHRQKMDSIGLLAGGIAHDFNNMLSGIIGAAEIIERKLQTDDEKVKKLNHTIIDAAERAASLIKKLLAFARKQPIEFQNINLHNIINETISILKQTIDKRIIIKTYLLANDPNINGDYSQLVNVLLNLGINASHAMPDGGQLTIETRELKSDYNKQLSGKYIEIKISDTGCGIPPNDLDKIFDPFYTTKEQGKGTGLGLAAVYGTINQHKGKISVTSVIDQGTTFTILLPLIETMFRIDLMETTYEEKINCHILVVDDEEVVRSTTKTFLEDLGHVVYLAENGSEALTVFREKFMDIDLVILDMMMPVMNGKDCFREMKNIDPNVKAILSSGFYTKKEYLDVMQENGLAGFLKKPYRQHELSKLINKVML